MLNQEYRLGEQDLLISRTNLQGQITYANPAFVEASGYALHELIGANHNLVRHPSMPKAAFANLWSCIQAGHTWQGLVKNRRQNGQFYWVQAHVVPLVEEGRVVGYASLRTCPDRDAVSLANQVYDKMQRGERTGYQLQQGQLTPTSVFAKVARIRWCAAEVLLPLLLLLLNAFFLLALSQFFIHATTPSLSWPWITGAGLFVLITNGLGWLLRRQLIQRTHQLRAFALQIAAGNLSVSPPVEDRSAMGQLAQALQTMRKGLLSIALDVHQSVAQISPQIETIAQSNQGIASQVTQQAAAMEELTSAIQSIGQDVRTTATHAQQAKDLAEQSHQQMQATQLMSQQAREAIKTTHQLTKKMSGILEAMQGIAFQTNILALNAAVEASRAGEHGRGFAVVAGEVKRLAHHSAQAAKEASSLITQSTQQMSTTSSKVTDIDQAMQSIEQASQTLLTLMHSLQQISCEQSQELSCVTQAAESVQNATLENSDHAAAAAEAAQHLDAENHQLIVAVSAFRTQNQQGRELTAEIQPSRS